MNNDSLVDKIASRENYLVSTPRSQRVLDAMRRVDRARFIPDENQAMTIVDEEVQRTLARNLELVMVGGEKPTLANIRSIVFGACELVSSARTLNVSRRALAYNDEVIPIGYDQTCSQPSMVAFMADALELQPGMNVLEIGTGCGYHAAVTAEIVGEQGKVYSVEFLPKLVSLARENLKNNFGSEYHQRVEVISGDGSTGLPDQAPFDAIYLTAGVKLGHFEPGLLARQLKLPGGLLLYPEEDGLMIRERYGRFGQIEEIQFYHGVQFVPLQGENVERVAELPTLRAQ